MIDPRSLRCHRRLDGSSIWDMFVDVADIRNLI